MNGHAFMTAQIELDAEIYPGMNDQHSLISRQFFRCAADKPFVRHDLRVWESAVGREPRLKGAGRPRAARRRPACRLAIARQARHRARARCTTTSTRRRQHADARCCQRRTRFGDAAAEDRASARRRDRGAAARRPSAISPTLFAQLAREHKRQGPVDERGQLSRSSRPAAVAWAPTLRRACATVSGALTITQPVRGRRADAADWRLHERHADVCRAHAAIGERGRRRRWDGEDASCVNVCIR